MKESKHTVKQRKMKRKQQRHNKRIAKDLKNLSRDFQSNDRYSFILEVGEICNKIPQILIDPQKFYDSSLELQWMIKFFKEMGSQYEQLQSFQILQLAKYGWKQVSTRQEKIALIGQQLQPNTDQLQRQIEQLETELDQIEQDNNQKTA